MEGRFQEEKIKAELQRSAAEFIKRESDSSSLITVTGIKRENDGRTCIILVTVLPSDQENQALKFLKRKKSLFGYFLKTKTAIGRPPVRVDFKIDIGERNRQKIDELSRQN